MENVVDAYESRLNKIRAVVAEILEINPEDLSLTSRFKEDHGGDSLVDFDIMTSLEKLFNIEIPQSLLDRIINLNGAYSVIAEVAGWKD